MAPIPRFSLCRRFAGRIRTLLCCLVFARAFGPDVATAGTVPVDVVFTLDLSGSTNGLVDDVRDQLWDIINQVDTYRPGVDLRIGVVAFSRPSFGRDNGYVKVLSDLTTNFELPAFELARLKPSIEKGDQLVGTALFTAVKDMGWSDAENAIKVIFLAGNGGTHLDRYRYRDAYAEAARRGIVVNTVYCFSSNYKKEIFRWKEIATQTGGTQYDMVVHHRNPIILTCTETDRLHELSRRFDNTYIAYGQYGNDVRHMIRLIDQTAEAASEQAFQSRLQYKLSAHFQSRQHQWDLVDYVKATNSDFRELDFQFLPDSLKGYTPARLRVLVMALKDERLRLMRDIRTLLGVDRQRIINETVRKHEYDRNPDTLDRIVISWLNRAAEERGITCFAN